MLQYKSCGDCNESDTSTPRKTRLSKRTFLIEPYTLNYKS